MQDLDMIGTEDSGEPREERWNLGRTVGAVAMGAVAALLWPARRITAGLLGAVAGAVVGGTLKREG